MEKEKLEKQMPESTNAAEEITLKTTLDSSDVSEEPFSETSDVVTINAGELSKLKEQAALAEEFKDKWLRAAAEIENIKKRFFREQEELRKYAIQNVLQKLLPIFDNLEIAIQATKQRDSASMESIFQGLQLILQQIQTLLKELGVEEINAEGQPFDYHYHEAVLSKETDEVPEGYVVQQIRKGYRLHDRLIRPAAVIVACKPKKEPNISSDCSQC